MMAHFLTSYTLNETRIQLSIGKLYGVLAICEKCKKFERGRCGNGKEGISICRYGCSVCKEEDTVYFGLHLKDNYNPNKALRFDFPLVLTCDQFQVLKTYDKQLDAFAALRMDALKYLGEYGKHISELKTALPDPKGKKWGQDTVVTTVNGHDMDRFLRALQALKDSRQKYSMSVSAPSFKDFLYFISNNIGNNALISPDSRCLRCRNPSCVRGSHKKNHEQAFERCPAGAWFTRRPTKIYCGFRVVELEKDRKNVLKRKNKNRILFKKDQLLNLICFIDRREEEINTARRFLHEIGQFLSAIQNLLPYTDGHEKQPVPIKVSSLLSIHAMVMALQCLTQQLFASTRNSIEKKQFSPFQLFDKYRYCFGGSSGEIHLLKGNCHDYYEQIYSYDGFEYAVLNLLTNAQKYLPPDNKHNSIDIKFNRYDKGMEIVVESMGVKIDDSDLTRLGTRWFRGRNAIAAGVQGEGLGLHSVVTLMRRSGFAINFFSSGNMLRLNGIDYRKFSVRIRITQDYIAPAN